MTRRSALSVIAAFINSAVVLALSIPAVRFLAHPLTRRRRSAEFTRVAQVSALPLSVPTRVAVVAERVDGFLRYAAAPIGYVWLERVDAGGESAPSIRCFQTICPHLGCGIDFDTVKQLYACPCHASDFGRDGARLSGPSPRGMDELECRVSDAGSDGERFVEVRYTQFKTGVVEREPLG